MNDRIELTIQQVEDWKRNIHTGIDLMLAVLVELDEILAANQMRPIEYFSGDAVSPKFEN